MAPLKRILILMLSGLLICACNQDPNTGSTGTEGSIPQRSYVSIDGLWRCTPETALRFESITLEATIEICGSMTDQLSVRACFVWEEQFRDYWQLSGISFNDSLNQITIRDQSGSVYVGTINEDNTSITGMVYSQDGNQLVPEDNLDFRRASGLSVERLFIPRKAGTDGSISYTYQQPPETEKGMQTGSIFQHVKDTAAVHEFMARVIAQEYGRLESLLILKDQQLVLEEYFYGYERSELHNVFSVTKSISSLLTGIALAEHELVDVKLPVLEFLPGIEPGGEIRLSEVSLEHVLTMTAGFQEDEAYLGLEQEDLIQHILNLPLEFEPGKEFRYNKECPMLLGGIIYSLEGMTADQYSKEKLFGPLGIKDYKWKLEKGVPYCHSHLQMLPRDMLKIGMLVLNKGAWDGRQIVPEPWISQSTLPHVQESPFFHYGYQWWQRSGEDQKWWKEGNEKDPEEHAMAIAIGFGGQFIFVIRDLNMLVVTTASDYNESTGMAFKKIPMVIEELIPLFEPGI